MRAGANIKLTVPGKTKIELERSLKGEKGTTFIPSVSEGGDLNWTNDGGLENPETVNIKGETGEKGDPGTDGVSPKLDVTNIDGGYEVSLTDADGTKKFTVLHGIDGEDGYTPVKGVDYVDGVSPTIETEENENGHAVSITDIDGTKTFSLTNGKDGVSPTIKVTEAENGYEVFLTDAEGTKAFVLTNGDDGVSPSIDVNGTTDGYEVSIIENGVVTETFFIPRGGVVGEITADGGEIFNSYENNGAFGLFTHAEGFTSIAGIRGYYFTKFVLSDDALSAVLYLSTEQSSEETEERNLDFTINYAVGDVISYVYGSKYLDIATITAIDTTNQTITVEAISEKTLGTGSFDTGVDDQIVYVYSKPSNGIVSLGHYAHTEGEKTLAVERSSHAEGRETVARGQYGHAEGRGTKAYYAAHAEGYKTEAQGDYSHAEGQSTKAIGGGSHAEGQQTETTGAYAHAEGTSTKAKGRASHAEGHQTIAASQMQHVQGQYNIEDTEGLYAHIVGWGDSSIRKNIHTLTTDGDGWFAGDVFVGSDREKLVKNTELEKVKTDIVSKKGLDVGALTSDGGEIFNNAVTANKYAHAEGYNTGAEGEYSHAEGYETKAIGAAAHSEGFSTNANGLHAHAEGAGTAASGDYAHAEGYGTEANGMSSHAGGNNSIANADWSVAWGDTTIANGVAQTAIGRNNIPDTTSAFIIGNGLEYTYPSNAVTIDWSGNAWFSGSVEAKGIILASSTPDSNKKFRLTVDDSGTLAISEI